MAPLCTFYYTILYYTILYYTLLYYTLLYSTLLYYTKLYTLNYILYYILYTFYYILSTIYYILYHTMPYLPILNDTSLHYSLLFVFLLSYNTTASDCSAIKAWAVSGTPAANQVITKVIDKTAADNRTGTTRARELALSITRRRKAAIRFCLFIAATRGQAGQCFPVLPKQRTCNRAGVQIYMTANGDTPEAAASHLQPGLELSRPFIR